MRLFSTYWLFFVSSLLLTLNSCTDEGPASSSAAAADTTAVLQPATALPSALPCPVPGTEVLGSHYLSPEQGVLVMITADSSTYDERLGQSFRVLSVCEPATCELLQREVLPIDQSPDFAYTLAAINYNRQNQLLAIQGATHFFLYDLATKSLSAPISPVFPKPRPGVDAQSGHIMQLELWENCLIGYAQDCGAFAFQLEEGLRAVPINPLSDYKAPEGSYYHQAFLLPSDTGQQIIVPAYDRAEGGFSINPILPKPEPIDTSALAIAQDGRFVLLRQQTRRKRPIVVDLLRQEQASLPSDIEWKSNADILDWMKVMQ